MAARTSGRSTDPPMMVKVPRQLMIGFYAYGLVNIGCRFKTSI
jgi:hypothetical protein